MNKITKNFTLVLLFIFSFLSAGDISIAQTVDGLDYLTSTSASFDLPKNIKLSLDWGYTGHRDILEPFHGIKLSVKKENNISNDQSNQSEQGFQVKELTKKIVTDILVNKANDYINNENSEIFSKMPPLFAWIVKRILKNGQTNSSSAESIVEEFLVKSYLLFKKPMDVGFENYKKVEFLALLIKLAISNPLEGFIKIDGQNALGFLDKIQDYVEPEFLGFLTEMFLSYQDNFSDCDFNNIDIKSEEKVRIGFVFADKTMANACAELFKYNSDYKTISDFKKRVENFVQEYVTQDSNIWTSVTNYKVVSYQDFAKYKNSSIAKFVGFEDFGVDISYPVLEKTVNGLKIVDKKFDVYLDEKNSEETWVYCVATNDKAINLKVIKYAVAAIFKAIDEYRKINSFDATEILNKIDVNALKNNLKNLQVAQISLKDSLNAIDANIKEKQAKLSSGWLWNSWFKDKYEKELADLNKEKDVLVQKLNIIVAKINELDAMVCNYDIDALLLRVKDKSFTDVVKQVIFADVRIARIVNNLLSKPEYQIVKDNLIKRMGLIFSNSKMVHEYWSTIEYILENLFPLFKKEIKDFGNSLNINLSLSDLLVSLVAK